MNWPPFPRYAGKIHDQVDFDGRAIFVRFVIAPLDADTIRFEQAFSDDGGKAWEINWVATDTRTTGRTTGHCVPEARSAE